MDIGYDIGYELNRFNTIKNILNIPKVKIFYKIKIQSIHIVEINVIRNIEVNIESKLLN